jgi:transposase
LYGRENEVIAVEQFDYIRYLYFNEGKSQRAIAKIVGIHRKSVKRAIENKENKYTSRKPKESPINADFKDLIKSMVFENSTKPKKHKLTKLRMHELIKAEGYAGSYSAFTFIVRKIEEELNLSQKEAYLKLEPAKGSMQVDFGEMVVMDKGVPRKVIAFCAKLSYSKGEFIKSYPRQSTEFFLDGLNSAFIFFGGVPKKIKFDNLKQAVKSITSNGERILQESFMSFKAFYCFDAIFCGPAKGNEKGMVENLVKYTRNNYFLPYPQFNTYEKLNDFLHQKCIERLNKNKFENKLWYTRLAEETSTHFLALKDIFDPAVIIDAKVDTYQLVHVDNNRYSVPSEYVGKKVSIKKYPFKIDVSFNGTLVASHDRLFGKNKELLNPYHYLDLLKRKARAFEEAVVIKQWNLPEIFDIYHRQLQAHTKSKSKGTREYISILWLTKTYGINKVKGVLKTFHEKNKYSYEEVTSILRAENEPSKSNTVLNYTEIVSRGLENVAYASRSLLEYNKLFTEGGDSNG